MYCTWLEYIRSCTEDPSQEFLVRRWLVHNHFICLDNSLEVVVHHLLIGRMIGLGYQDEFLMVSALVCMVTHWIRLIVSHDFTRLLHCIIFESWKNIELVLKLAMTLTYRWDRNLFTYSLWIGSLFIGTLDYSVPYP